MATVPEHAVPLPLRSGLIERLRLAFFRSFFRLLVLFVAVAEWACIAWVLGLFGIRPPFVAHVLAPVVIFLFNRRVLVRGRPRRAPFAQALVRGYVAFAFTSVFAALFLFATTLVWAAAAV